MSEKDLADFRPARDASPGIIVIVLFVVVVAMGGWWYWAHREVAAPPSPPPVASAPQPDADGPAAPSAVASGPENPIDALAEPDAVLPTLAESDAFITKALTELAGRASVASFLQLDGFARRVVATVDNLSRSQAPSRLWPVQPAPQRFTVLDSGEGHVISPDNAARYTAFVRFCEAVDTDAAVKLYARLYPLFQQAYEELGYPGRYFNDLLVAVIDDLLLAPEPPGPVQVRLVEVKGDVSSERPWVRYEYVDPKLESMSSGQKIMVRMGSENERKLKAKLRGLRQQIATGDIAKNKKPQ